MTKVRLSSSQITYLVILWAVAMLPGLGSASRLSYHEALVAEGAREILSTGDWSSPIIGGLPWLEKPPLPWWLVALLGWCTGGVNATISRLPSALAAAALTLAVAMFASRHYGARIGVLAGAIQTTTAWAVMRGRLAEADVLLACLVTGAIVAFDRLCNTSRTADENAAPDSGQRQGDSARWAFFTFLGCSALAKGIGFGAALIAFVVGIVLLWQRDPRLLRALWFPRGWLWAGALGLAWPIVMVMRYGPEAITLWTTHFTDRLVVHQGHGSFASEPWWEYLPTVLGQGLPWSLLALLGAWRSLGRAIGGADRGNPAFASVGAGKGAVDRLLWAWSAGPLVLLSVAAVKNSHYTVCAQVPWSVWAALELEHLVNSFGRRWQNGLIVRQGMKHGFAMLAFGYGLGFWSMGPWLDQRGVEWAFYESISRRIPPDVPLALLYDDWDRNAYESPLGSLPHDLAVRLFYLHRQACWHAGIESLAVHTRAGNARAYLANPTRGQAGAAAQRCTTAPLLIDNDRARGIAPVLAVIGRERDISGLKRLGRVEILASGPRLRGDRTYTLFCIALEQLASGSSISVGKAGIADLTLRK